MLKKFSEYCKIAFGIDPIWRGKKYKFKKLKVLGKFIENVNLLLIDLKMACSVLTLFNDTSSC